MICAELLELSFCFGLNFGVNDVEHCLRVEIHIFSNAEDMLREGNLGNVIDDVFEHAINVIFKYYGICFTGIVSNSAINEIGENVTRVGVCLGICDHLVGLIHI